jgi:hypothetical protein
MAIGGHRFRTVAANFSPFNDPLGMSMSVKTNLTSS